LFILFSYYTGSKYIYYSTVVHVPNVMNKGIPLSVCVDALTFNTC
jgi:hypothetical protein